MATISTHLRNFKEPTKDQLTQLFFSLPVDPQIDSVPDATAFREKLEKDAANGSPSGSKGGTGLGSENGMDMERMEISATLSLGVSGVEEPYVSSICSLVLYNVC